ncbi:MAG: ABC transporter ATP-binding protein [Verrucomicrobiae bacterium]|nr:ABC transporter ATP-binding protein [Verrucomicrobiae bacterium]
MESNSNPIISVRGLGKRYRLGAALAQDTLRDHLTHLVGGLWRRDQRKEPQELWALREVSFDVGAGEVLGIIGRNGAGKSTLLKVLSQITEPTEGEARVRGRLASLLEVGTGFHPELTGRENIYLNGAILGMSKAEIRRKFDEIVAFAEVEEFLDTPVKRYSSGMYVRLAFAVAAHLEPEILLVDEVLAVGDVAFQEKCLGKMREVTRGGGRTVLFVSHNMAAVQALCGRALWLDRGRVMGVGPVEEQVARYLDEMRQHHKEDARLHVVLGPSLVLERLVMTPNPVVSGQEVSFEVEIKAAQAARLTDFQLLLFSALGVRVAMVDLRQVNGHGYTLQSGQRLVLNGRIRRLPLVEGDYRVGVFYSYQGHYADVLDLVALHVAAAPPADGRVPYKPAYRGLVVLDYAVEAQISS